MSWAIANMVIGVTKFVEHSASLTVFGFRSTPAGVLLIMPTVPNGTVALSDALIVTPRISAPAGGEVGSKRSIELIQVFEK